MNPDVGNEVSLSQTGKSKHFCLLSVYLTSGSAINFSF